MHKDSITIAIPVYNQAEFLPEAIESALAQTFPCEIIVVNDGSTDDSLEVARSYEKRGIKVINQVNKGLASARNTAIMNMTGDYFLPLDADDILLETCAEEMQTAIKEYGPDVVSPSFRAFGVTLGEFIFTIVPSLDDFKTSNRLGYFSAIKKEVLLEVGGYNPKMIYGYEDYDLWIDIFKRKKSLGVLKNVLVLYRTKESSMITIADQHRDELMEQMAKNHPDVFV